MIKQPYTKWINDIKAKLGFNRTMTASGKDVVDAVNKQAQQIENLNGSKQIKVTDYDLVTDTGVYLASANANTLHAPDPNIPGRFYNLSVWKTSTNMITQIANSATYDTLYVRWKGSNGWSEWGRLITNLGAAVAYVEDGDTATQKTYSEGEFIVWKGSLYTVNSGGLPLDTVISGNVTAVTGGGFNALTVAISSYLKTSTITGTTTAAGSLATNINITNITIVAALVDGVRCIPFAADGKWWIAMVDMSAGQFKPLGNRQITCTIIYHEI